MRTFIRNVPLSVAAFAIAVVIAIGLSPTIARWTHASRPVAALLLLGFGLVLSATIMPTSNALDGSVSDGMCSAGRIGFLSPWELTRVSTASLNVLLFLPLGIAVGMLPRTVGAGVAIIAAVSLPFIVEIFQMLFPFLGRNCQVADVFDNLMGLAIGAVVGSLLDLLRRRWPGRLV